MRNFLFVKSITLALVWTFTTVAIPLLEANADILDSTSLYLFVRRFIFLFSPGRYL
jgi:hypothetical protein